MSYFKYYIIFTYMCEATARADKVLCFIHFKCDKMVDFPKSSHVLLQPN